MDKRLVATEYQFKEEFGDHTRPGIGVKFRLMSSPFYKGEKWSVKILSNCLNKDGEWEYEPTASNCDKDFFKRCRFDSLYEAVDAVDEAMEKSK